MRTNKHVQDICRKAYIDIGCIRSICHPLSIDAKKTLLSAFVLPKLDYCNSIFNGSRSRPISLKSGFVYK